MFVFFFFFFFNDTATTEIYTTTDTLSLHDALPIHVGGDPEPVNLMAPPWEDVEPRRRSEEHTSELQSPVVSSYAVFCLKKKKKKRGQSKSGAEKERKGTGQEEAEG